MDIKEVLALVSAGFTADEIKGMLQPVPEVSNEVSPSTSLDHVPLPEETASAATEAEAPPVPEKDPLDDMKNIIAQQIGESMKAYEDKMANVLKLAGMPAMADVKPKGVEDIITSFFKEE